ncbi:hypothetical protein [Paeniglutamicibacter cryotolerans]|uniref:Uncharacterized protein n=1 Tax=Paeniglutamicibacter cryotolerans TaxID=670079 RepID=A0A839QJC8_9MICC|nr:hypothetical protein [Paeniglutamicibacter cryotolerans]MBB2994645.1 hypothetical protein [Paeniglutamicibacter cryotolerans]
MTEALPPERTWKPRHRGWKLAHHLVPAFVLITFLAGIGILSIYYGRLTLASAIITIAVAAAAAVISVFMRPADDAETGLADVQTSTGVRAGTYFPMFPVSKVLAAVIVGFGVIATISALALGAKLLFLHNSRPLFLAVAATIALLAAGLLILAKGLGMARLAAAAQPAGVYLTRSRVLVFGAQGSREMYWAEVGRIDAEDPPGRHPLGLRGPALLMLRKQPGPPAPGSPISDQRYDRMQINVQDLAVDPDRLLAALDFYAGHGPERAELGTAASLERIAMLA